MRRAARGAPVLAAEPGPGRSGARGPTLPAPWRRAAPGAGRPRRAARGGLRAGVRPRRSGGRSPSARIIPPCRAAALEEAFDAIAAGARAAVVPGAGRRLLRDRARLAAAPWRIFSRDPVVVARRPRGDARAACGAAACACALPRRPPTTSTGRRISIVCGADLARRDPAGADFPSATAPALSSAWRASRVIPVLDARRCGRPTRRRSAAGVPSLELMENAAAEPRRGARSRAFPAGAASSSSAGPATTAATGWRPRACSPGAGFSASVFTLRDPEAYRGDAAENARARAGERHRADPARGLPEGAGASRGRWRDSDGVVDALFGTGLTRALTGGAAGGGRDQLGSSGRSWRRTSRRVSPRTRAIGSGPRVRATLTVAFAAPKLCHVFFPAREVCGRVVVRRHRDPGAGSSSRARPSAFEAATSRDLLPAAASRDSHKGDFGRLAIVAGSRGKAGAAALCARAERCAPARGSSRSSARSPSSRSSCRPFRKP